MAAAKRVRVRSSRVHRRRYNPTVFTIQQALDSIPDDADLEKFRSGLRQIVQDEKLWGMLKDVQEMSEDRRRFGEAIAKKLKAYKFK